MNQITAPNINEKRLGKAQELNSVLTVCQLGRYVDTLLVRGGLQIPLEPYTFDGLSHFFYKLGIATDDLSKKEEVINMLGEIPYSIAVRLADNIAEDLLVGMCKKVPAGIAFTEIKNNLFKNELLHICLFENKKIDREDFDSKEFDQYIRTSNNSRLIHTLCIYFGKYRTSELLNQPYHTLVLYFRYEQMDSSWYDALLEFTQYCVDSIESSEIFHRVAIVFRTPYIFDPRLIQRFYENPRFSLCFATGDDFQSLIKDQNLHFVHMTDGSHDIVQGGIPIINDQVIQNRGTRKMSVLHKLKYATKSSYISAGAGIPGVQLDSSGRVIRVGEPFSAERWKGIYGQYTKAIASIIRLITKDYKRVSIEK